MHRADQRTHPDLPCKARLRPEATATVAPAMVDCSWGDGERTTTQSPLERVFIGSFSDRLLRMIVYESPGGPPLQDRLEGPTPCRILTASRPWGIRKRSRPPHDLRFKLVYVTLISCPG